MIGIKSKKSNRISRRKRNLLVKKRKYIRYAIFAFVCYLFFLIITLPAYIPFSFLKGNAQLQRQVKITAVTGTAWSGSASSVEIAGINLGSLNWSLNVLPLLLGELNVHIYFDNHAAASNKLSGSGTVSINLGGELRATKFRGVLSADALGPLMYGMPARFSGNMNIFIDELVLVQGQRINIKSRVVVSNAGLVSPQRIDYGNILIQSNPRGDGTQITLNDQGGPLILDGVINLKGNGIYNLSFGMGARNSASSDLETGLRFLGQRDAAGKYRYKMNGKLQNW